MAVIFLWHLYKYLRCVTFLGDCNLQNHVSKWVKTQYVFGFGWTCIWRFAFSSFCFILFFLAHISALGDKVHCSCTVEHYSRTIEPWFLTFLCTQVGLVHCSRDPQTSLFSKFFIENESHSTIHTFKNYFATVFSVFSKISCIQTYP